MKKAILIIFTLISTISISQLKIDSVSNRMYIEKVIEVENQTKVEIYNNSLIWFAQTFKNSDEVITAKVEGRIISGNYSEKYTIISSPVSFTHSIELKFKDNKVKVKIYNVNNYLGYPLRQFLLKRNNTKRKMYNKTYIEIEEKLNNLSNSLENSLKNKDEEKW